MPQASALPTGLHPLGSSFEDEASEPEVRAGLPYAAAGELSAQQHLHGDQEPGEPPGLITEAHSAPSTPGLMSMLLSCPHHHAMWPFSPRASMAVWPHGCTQTHRQQALQPLRGPRRVLCSEQALGRLPTSGTRQTLSNAKLPSNHPPWAPGPHSPSEHLPNPCWQFLPAGYRGPTSAKGRL